MSLSRTARILIALLLVAAAAFVWVSYLRNAEPQTTLAGTPTTVPGAAAADAAANSPTTTAAPLLATGSEAIVGAPASAPAADTGATEPTAAATATGAADEPSPVSVPAVVAPPTVVLRDLVVDDLPFLVTSPPVVETTQAEEEAGGATRPQAGRRGNINPFSPVLVQTPQAQPEPVLAEAPTSSPEPTVIVVNNDGAPPAGASATSSQPSATVVAAAQPAQAPAPRALAPASSGVGELPRPLPSGTLPLTPDILRDARTAPPVQSPSQAETPVAALVEPTETAPTELPPVGDGPVEGSAAPVEVLGPGQPSGTGSEPTEPVVAMEPSTPTNVQKLPLVAGIDTLSRYLRDNDVRFTGTALGPLSVGVFRANHLDQPVVLTLGQSLPDTDIVLADLRGYEAKFSLGDSTQVLSLDLRR